MKFSKFEFSIYLGMMIGWGYLMFGYRDEAFYMVALLITIVLMGIMEYVKLIYMSKKE